MTYLPRLSCQVLNVSFAFELMQDGGLEKPKPRPEGTFFLCPSLGLGQWGGTFIYGVWVTNIAISQYMASWYSSPLCKVIWCVHRIQALSRVHSGACVQLTASVTMCYRKSCYVALLGK